MKVFRVFQTILFLTVFQITYGQLDYAAFWKIVNKESNDTLDITIFIRNNEMILQRGKKFVYKGEIRPDDSFEVFYTYPTIKDVPDLDDPNNPRNPKILKLYTSDVDSLNPIIFKGIFDPEGTTTLTQVFPKFDKTGKRIKDKEIEYEMLPDNRITIDDSYGNRSYYTANFSDPFPEVKIDPASVQISPAEGNYVTINLKAEIRDILADIVDSKADIQTVFLEYIDHTKDEYLISTVVPIKKIKEEPTKWRPYAHNYRAEVSSLSIPLIAKETYVNLNVVNALGNKTRGAIVIKATDNIVSPEENEDPRSKSYDFEYKTFDIVNGTSSGFSNPVQLNLKRADYVRASIYQNKIANDTIIYNGREIILKPDLNQKKPNDFYLETPLIGLVNIPDKLKDIPNLIDVKNASNDFEFKHGDLVKKLTWNYTENSPATVYTYAIGLKNNHFIKNEKFRFHNKAKIISIRDLDNPNDILISSKYILSQENRYNMDGLKGLKIKFKIPYNTSLIGKKAVFEIKWENDVTELIGTFKIGNLKTIIIGVDGFGYDAATSVTYNKDAKDGFGKIFNPKENFVRDKVLSAIPTVTWCNWTGIYSGQPPSEHGIIGNSFFAFNSGILTSHIPSISALLYGFNKRAYKQSRSLFDNQYPSYPRKDKYLNVYTLYPWYNKSNYRNVRIEERKYIGNVKEVLANAAIKAWLSRGGVSKGIIGAITYHDLLELKNHDPHAGRRLDFETSVNFLNNVADRLQYDSNSSLDIVSMYFPGPDNVAHYLGSEYPEDYNKEAPYEFEDDLKGITYDIGPDLPNVDEPLYAVKEHASKVTNYYLTRNIAYLEENGLLYSTMFVLIADHGLHAFINDEEDLFNIFPADIIGLILKNKYEIFKDDTFFKRHKLAIRKRVNQSFDEEISERLNSYEDFLRTSLQIHFKANYPSDKIDLIIKTQSGSWQSIESPYGLQLLKEEGWNISQYKSLMTFIFSTARTNQELLKYTQTPSKTIKTIEYPFNSTLGNVMDYSPNGGMAHLYISMNDPKEENDYIEDSARILYLASTGLGKKDVYSRKLGPKSNPVISGSKDNGAFGKFPAIFIKSLDEEELLKGNKRLSKEYEWVKGVDAASGKIDKGSIEEFLSKSGHTSDWPEFKARLEEMNDKSSISRSGDILLFTDGEKGYLTVNEKDEYNGWHGGATKSESYVPMFINIPGDIVDEQFIYEGHKRIKDKWTSSSNKNHNSKLLRNWHLSQVLASIFSKIPKESQ